MFFKKRVFLALLLGVLFLFFLSQKNKHSSLISLQAGWVDRAAMSLIATVLNSVNRLWFFTKDTWNHYIALVKINRENQLFHDKLKTQELYILSLEEKLKVQRQAQPKESQFTSLGYEGIMARVIGYDPFSQVQAIMISVGSKNGVGLDQPVITSDGLVGRVIRVYGHSSQVLLVVDNHFAVDVIDHETRVRGLLVGSGTKAGLGSLPLMSHLEFLGLGQSMYEGDLLVTSGLNGVYPPSIPVGNLVRLKSSKENQLAVLPSVDFSTLSHVFVITKMNLNEKNKVTP